jgi:hypothetical protein
LFDLTSAKNRNQLILLLVLALGLFAVLSWWGSGAGTRHDRTDHVALKQSSRERFELDISDCPGNHKVMTEQWTHIPAAHLYLSSACTESHHVLGYTGDQVRIDFGWADRCV